LKYLTPRKKTQNPPLKMSMKIVVFYAANFYLRGWWWFSFLKGWIYITI